MGGVPPHLQSLEPELIYIMYLYLCVLNNIIHICMCISLWAYGPRKMGMQMAWMTMAPVTPPELRQSQALPVDSEPEASPGTPPLEAKSASRGRKGRCL